MRTFGRLATGLLLVLAMLVPSTPAQAATSVSGQVTCAANQNVGIWVQANSGGSGWASRTTLTLQTSKWSYSLPNGGSYQVHVGCGGTSQNWDTNNKSGNVTGGKSFTCYDLPSYGWKYKTCQVT